MRKFESVEKYLKSVPQRERTKLKHMGKIVMRLAPDAQEMIGYQMPGYKYRGEWLVGFAAFKNHCSFFPYGSSIIKKFGKELKKFSLSKGTIRFTLEKPISDSLLKKIIKAKMKEIEAKQKRIA
ncbi:MAG: DUF1801 domain-containing protein [Candidatus Micrarchaeota archaeon]|nr:DUF1801 domain-containing protein [Candidatus Micrarchaeota archaeon]